MSALLDFTHYEADRLAKCEATIERGLATFVDVGTALLEVRDSRLYRAQYATFEAYCAERWNLSRKRAYDLTGAAETVRALSPIGDIQMPANEAQARELAGLTPEAQREAWQLAVETAPEGKVTAAHVRAVVRINEALADAPEPVQDVVRRYGVADADTITELTRLHKQRRDTFEEVAASGYIQPGEEDDAVHIADGALAVRGALQEKARTHRALALEDRPYPLTASNHISGSDGYDGDEWYTPAEYVEAARRVMGGIDLDPASCEIAQRTVRAAHYFTKEDDGLQFNWPGRVFLNPPYSYPLIEKFTGHLIAQVGDGFTTEAILLVNNSSDTDWFQALLARYPACFTDGRVRFYRDTGEYFGTRQGQTFFYCGPNPDRFVTEFARYGVVVEAVS